MGSFRHYLHDSYPSYPRESYISMYEKRDFVQPYEWGITEMSRGCKFKCDFCNFPILGVKGDYSRTQEDFDYEMRYNYDNFGITQYMIADETFNDRPEKIRKFADVAEKLPFRPWFTAFIRADLLFTHRDTWDDLDRLGVAGQFYGIETFNHASGKTVGKGMHPDKIKQGLLDYQKYQEGKLYRGGMGMIIGLPHEDKLSILETRKWLLKNWKSNHLSPYILDVGPDSEDHMMDFTNISSFRRNLEKYGLSRMSAQDIEDYKNNNKQSKNLSLPYVYGEHTTDNIYKWKHDKMNIFEAQELWNDWQEEINENYRTGPWEMFNQTARAQTTLRDSPELLDYDIKNALEDSAPQRQAIKTYIDQKLNLY